MSVAVPEAKKSVEETLGTCCLIWLVWPISHVWHGFVLSTLWGWFMVPTFGLPALSILTAIGVRMTVGMMTPYSSAKPKDSTSWTVAMAFYIPTIALSVGYVVRP